MAFLDIGIWVSVSSAFIGLGIALFLFEDRKKGNIWTELDETYWKLRQSVLDPIIEQIMRKRRGREDPHKVISTPEVSELLKRYRDYLEEYITADGYRYVISSALSYSFHTAVGIGVAVIVVSLSNEFYFQLAELILLTFAIIGIGSIFLVFFLSRYRFYYNEYMKQIRKIRRTI